MSMFFKGKVVNGNKIGRRIGFPTANIVVGNDVNLRNGVYQAVVALDGQKFDAVVNIGVKPTIGSGENRVLEAHLLGFSGDIYGKEIEVELGDFIREEHRFSSIAELRDQIEKDKNEIIKRISKC